MPSEQAVENFKEVVGSGLLSGIVQAMARGGCPGPEEVPECVDSLARVTCATHKIGVRPFEMGPNQKVKLDMDLAVLQGAATEEKVREWEPIIDKCVKDETELKIQQTVERAFAETGAPPEQIEINLQVANAGPAPELGPPTQAWVKFEDSLLLDESVEPVIGAVVQRSVDQAVKHEIRRLTHENGVPPAQVNVQLQSAIEDASGQPQVVEPPVVVPEGGLLRPGEYVREVIHTNPVEPITGLGETPEYVPTYQQPRVQVTTNYGTYVGTTGAITAGTAGYTWHGQVGSVLQPYVHTVDNNLTYTINAVNGTYQYHLTQATDQTYQIYTTQGTVPITFTGAEAGATFTVNGGNITWGTTGTGGYTYSQQSYVPTPKEILKQAIRRRLSPEEQRRRRYLAALQSPAEQKARDTLRDMISENEWRRYVTNSFVMVKGPSGKHYQVFNDSRHLQVFEKGKNIAGLCIHSHHECPPTDHVLNMKMLIEFDEQAVWAGSNINWKSGYGPKIVPMEAGGTNNIVLGNNYHYGVGNAVHIDATGYNVVGVADMQNGVQYAVLGAPPAQGAGGGGIVENDPVRATALFDRQLNDGTPYAVAGALTGGVLGAGGLAAAQEVLADALIGRPATEATMARGAAILRDMIQANEAQPNVVNPYNADGYARAREEVAAYAVDGIMYGEQGSKDKPQSLVDIYRQAKGTKTA